MAYFRAPVPRSVYSKAVTARPVSRRRAAWFRPAVPSAVSLRLWAAPQGTRAPGTEPSVLRDAPSGPARRGAARAGREQSPAGPEPPRWPRARVQDTRRSSKGHQIPSCGQRKPPLAPAIKLYASLGSSEIRTRLIPAPCAQPRTRVSTLPVAVPWPEAAACLRACSGTPQHAPAVMATVTQDKLNWVQQQLSVSTQGLLKLDRKQQPATRSIDLFSQHIRRLQKDTYQPPKKITPVLLLSA